MAEISDIVALFGATTEATASQPAFFLILLSFVDNLVQVFPWSEPTTSTAKWANTANKNVSSHKIFMIVIAIFNPVGLPLLLHL